MRNRSDSRHNMATIDFPNLLIFILLCLTSLLTSPISDAIAPDGKILKWQTNQDISNVKKLLPLYLEHTSNAIDNKNISKENVTSISIMAEGGPISIFPSTRRINLKNTSINNLEKSRERENISRERNFSSSVVARKGVEEKIKPRKGVDQLSVDLEKEKLSYAGTKSFENTKPVVEDTSITKNNININNQFKTSNMNESSLTNLSSNANSNHSTKSDTNLTATDRNMSHIEAKNATTSKLSLYDRHKPKPTVTSVDGAEVDEPIRSSRIKSSPLGIPRKIDYIVPVIITIIALPLLGAASFVLYRRGRDCWDKRHYRRMDFLIDGMYND